MLTVPRPHHARSYGNVSPTAPSVTWRIALQCQSRPLSSTKLGYVLEERLPLYKKCSNIRRSSPPLMRVDSGYDPHASPYCKRINCHVCDACARRAPHVLRAVLLLYWATGELATVALASRAVPHIQR